MSSRKAISGGTLLLILGLLTSGCAQLSVVKYVVHGEYGQAREFLQNRLTTNRGNRNFILQRMSLNLVNLADGLPESAETTINETYEMLRLQGLNEDRTVASVVISEDVKIWKGEPFEQALMYCYISIQKALCHDWGNARAAAASSLFLLKDFGENEDGERKSTVEIAETAQTAEQEDKDTDYLDNGYVAVETDFALGYLLHGIMNAAMGRDAEGSDNYDKARSIDDGLQQTVQRLMDKKYNTVLVVDYGLGPRKKNYGPDGVFAKFVSHSDWPSDSRPLVVRVNENRPEEFAVACDLNSMAQDHTWTNMEEVRLAKSVIGTGLVGAGLSTMARNRSVGGLIVGGTIALIGAGIKAGARADTRHCDIMPQRVYVAPLTLSAGENKIALQVANDETSCMLLTAVHGPGPPERLQLLYIRLTPNKMEPPAWAKAGDVLYTNDVCDMRVPGDELPYILGGRCVCTPSSRGLIRYQQAGYLQNMTLVELENLYREEGIALATSEGEGGGAGRHVLEGGTSLACPRPGSAGFPRLFCQEHKPYRPRSKVVAALANKLRAQREPAVTQKD